MNLRSVNSSLFITSKDKGMFCYESSFNLCYMNKCGKGNFHHSIKIKEQFIIIIVLGVWYKREL